MTLAHTQSTARFLGVPILMLLMAGLIPSPSGAATAAETLAIVGPDTLTTTDLRIELGIMENQKSDGAQSSLPEADKVLRRLVQNRLVTQEGYRMGLHEEFTVANQVIEFVRHKMITSLLDSVVASVPADAEDLFQTRRLAVGGYLADLRERYHVTVDSTLLASLDYGSADKDMQKYLREDQTVLAVVPNGQLTVEGFSRILRFTEFHGLIGKPDAAKKRDKVFQEWLAEAVLFHQIKLQKVDQQERFVTLRHRMESNLVLQEALRLLLQFDFAPEPGEVQAFYQDRLEEFKLPPRVKMASLKTASHDDALKLRQRIQDGAPVSWLKKNVAEVVKGPAPFPSEFFAPAKLGLNLDEVEMGWVPEPYQVPSGWVVAQIIEIEDPQPVPLESCQGKVLNMMKSEQTRDLMINILAQLEEATPVNVLPGAEATVQRVIEEFAARNADVSAETLPSPSQEG